MEYWAKEERSGRTEHWKRGEGEVRSAEDFVGWDVVFIGQQLTDGLNSVGNPSLIQRRNTGGLTLSVVIPSVNINRNYRRNTD